MNGEDEDNMNEDRLEAEKNSRRRPRAASSERQNSSTSSSPESSYHEAPNSGEASNGMTDEGIKRRKNRNSDSPPSADSFASCEGSSQDDEMAGNNTETNDNGLDALTSEQSESAENEDEHPDELNNDSDDDEEKISVGVRARTKRESSKTIERPSVLDKSQSKPRYNFIQDLFLLSSNSLRPSAFRARRCADLDLVQRFELAHKLEGHQGCVNAIHFNETGSRLASGSDDLEIIVWDWQKAKKELSFKSGHTSNVFQSKFLPYSGDTLIATTSRDGQVRLAELSATGSCRSTRKVASHKGPAHKLALFNGKPHEFLSGGEDGLMIHIDVRQPKPNKLVIQKGDNDKPVPIYSVHANPFNNNLIATAGSDQFVRLFDRRYVTQENPKPFQKFVPRHLATKTSIHITCAVFSNDGQDVIATYSDEDIYLFHTHDTGDEVEYVKRYQGHCNSQTVKGVNFYGPESEFVVSGSDCGHIFFWDREGEDIVHMVKGDDNGVVNCLEPHPNLPMMATSGLDDEIKIWTPSSKTKVSRNEIEETVMKNADKSSQGIHGPGNIIGGQMLWQILRHIQRSERRRARAMNRASAENGEDEQDSDDDSDDSESDDDEDDDDDDSGPLQCAQS